MAFYFLNKLDKSLSKKDLEIEFKKFGQLKVIENIREDKFDKNFNFTVAVFHQVLNETSLKTYCQSKGIKLKEKVDNQTKQNNGSFHTETAKEAYKNIIQNNISNPSFYFYKDKAYGKNIENFQLKNNYQALFEIQDAKKFELTTTYPGLLVGSGYNHPKVKENKDDFQLGFFFDHTTGLPLISGSSIKGVLKSVASNEDFMNEVYKTKIPLNIFEDNQTIFYDAFILSTTNKNNKIFGSDFITSHYSDEENGEFKNPNPVKFLKILPDVTFQFQFKCDEKYRDIFKEIIIDFGLGAKTNVGYGKFVV